MYLLGIFLYFKAVSSPLSFRTQPLRGSSKNMQIHTSEPKRTCWNLPDGPNLPLQSNRRESRMLLSFCGAPRSLAAPLGPTHTCSKRWSPRSSYLICDSSCQTDAWLMYKQLACCFDCALLYAHAQMKCATVTDCEIWLPFKNAFELSQR